MAATLKGQIVGVFQYGLRVLKSNDFIGPEEHGKKQLMDSLICYIQFYEDCLSVSLTQMPHVGSVN